ncbi:MAG: hypothetical protein HeimC3_17130 [Candidatus Heimdallarchaeota archaeon LC_3]|nr:MAG: hypothetical protein HeimC3_17130 [Candidatus Heimdallarchaeota archaeon LC_3]
MIKLQSTISNFDISDWLIIIKLDLIVYCFFLWSYLITITIEPPNQGFTFLPIITTFFNIILFLSVLIIIFIKIFSVNKKFGLRKRISDILLKNYFSVHFIILIIISSVVLVEKLTGAKHLQFFEISKLFPIQILLILLGLLTILLIITIYKITETKHEDWIKYPVIITVVMVITFSLLFYISYILSGKPIICSEPRFEDC